MRITEKINEGWRFCRKASDIPETFPEKWEAVTLPHTWNAKDGQDGGNDYYRGTCLYARRLSGAALPEGEVYFLEVRGANSSADVYLNGQHLAHHNGGYSTFRVELTDVRREENLLVVAVDNAPSERVYPQMADFTFYGGLYRDVYLIAANRCHFDLSYWGGSGLQVVPTVVGESAEVAVTGYPAGATGGLRFAYSIYDADGALVTAYEGLSPETVLKIPHVHLWQGREDPYLYTLRAELILGDMVVDTVTLSFGCRSFRLDPEKGFFLNGRSYPLRGVSRHQDRLGIGNALLPEHHREDAALMLEMGANTVRLAHYQHDQYFYDLCDRYGLVVWAEIPYISQHLPEGVENTATQMRELIIQCHHHPSIVFWGLSNEITMKGDRDPALLENHRMLNELCHTLDPTRKTVVAAVSPCPTDSPYLQIPDAVAYNHYFGWYGGEVEMNGPWFDRFHAAHPTIPIGCSEYGCEALNWHNSDPVQGDYTEEYQAHYHEQMILQLYTRPYLFATFVWNMFDFGADARCEGGENGQNHKGLVTMDRRYKKDAFYAYKAWLSDEPFVHICGKRYVERTEAVTRVTVYSNQPEVELLLNGRHLARKSASQHFFYFDVPNEGESVLTAVAGDCRDESVLRRVEVFNEGYRLKEQNAVINWFEVEMPAGKLSINSKVADVLRHSEGRQLFEQYFAALMPQVGESAGGFEMTPAMMEMMGSFTVLRLSSMIGMMGASLTKEQLLAFNHALNQIEMP
ncbi:MAG: glycoside hydrolase family 2 protein [Ruminococcaceae bacterium]|nr:glycoside hydrolase family 2 protein [Oscillospiraceae bacterium]